MVKKITLSLIVVIALFVAYLQWGFNRYQQDGELRLSVLEQPVTVLRDELGIPYIYAQSMADALRAQGFITAQDRLYQLELYRKLANGQLAAMFGARALKSDVLIRTLGIQALAAEQIALLTDAEKQYYGDYIAGINSYIEAQQQEHPFSIQMLGLDLQPWTLQDIIALQFFQVWGSSANWQTELLAQQLLDQLGPELANEISMLTVNPDDEVRMSAQLAAMSRPDELGLSIDPELAAVFPRQYNAASNAWASDNNKSTSGSAIFSNSPHIDARTLPGFWYPMGIFTPQLRTIGATAPGSPGFGIGRTEHIVFGATNGYSDGVDLYIETLDSELEDHYLEGEKSLPLAIREEIIRIKDDEAQGGYREHSIRIRSTRRGPLLSDHGIELAANRAISLRWATKEGLSDNLGMRDLWLATTIDEARLAMAQTPAPLSYMVVDHTGAIARISAGQVPKRLIGDGSKPYVVIDSSETWDGLIPAAEMPIDIRPQQGWVGTANHRVVKADYPYAYSTFFSPAWRYRRIKEFMGDHQQVSADDHWRLINDVKNPMAEQLLPDFITLLASDDNTAQLAELLQSWNYHDQVDQVGAAVFQLTMKHLVRLTFNDQITGETWERFFDSDYYWQERLVQLMEDNNNHWFDDIATAETETRDDLIITAALAAQAELVARLGDDPRNWQWGKVLNITFSSPVIPGKSAAKWLGAGTHPMFGSSETLNRGKYLYSSDYEAKAIDSTRFVADMADTEKVMAVIPGGSSGRYLNNTLHNQTAAWLSGDRHYWWFSDDKIKQHAVHTLTLLP